MYCEVDLWSVIWKSLNVVAGETDEERIHEPVSFGNFLRVREAERAGESQHHLDC